MGRGRQAAPADANPATAALRPALRRILVALGLGALGGALFNLADMPLAWMLGAMCVTTVAALGGMEIAVPNTLRGVMVAILGIMLGGVFTPDLLARAGQWGQSILVVGLFVVTATLMGLVYFRVIGRFDPVTAYCSATPGGLNEMVLTGEAMGGDPRRISLVHAVRILTVVFFVPFYFRVIQGVDVPSAPVALGGGGGISLADGLILGLCGVAGYPIARRLKIPAAPLVGPMVLSAAVHLAGFTTSRPPTEAIALAQVVIGSAVGCRFGGEPLARVWRTLVLAVGSSVMMIALAAAFAALLGALGMASPVALFLSFAPGGLAEMSLIALALGIDTAFVSTMHIFRIIFVVICAPATFRLLRRRKG